MTRRNVIAVAAGIAVLLLAWYLLLWSPKNSQIDAAHERRDATIAEAQQLEVRLQQLRLAAERLPELVELHDRVSAAVPQVPELAEFLLAANAAAKATGVEYLTVSPQPPAIDAAGPSKIGVAVTVKARYGQLLDFMQRLLDMPRVLVIDSMQVAPAEDGMLSVSIAGRTFTAWVPGAAPIAPAPTTPAPAPTPAPDQVAGPATEVAPG